MISTAIPVLTIVAGIILIPVCAEFILPICPWDCMVVSPVGMLSTLGITWPRMLTDRLPIMLGGNAEMSQLGRRSSSSYGCAGLLGNTTAATGKGFAIDQLH